jgi:hypothetical protein
MRENSFSLKVTTLASGLKQMKSLWLTNRSSDKASSIMISPIHLKCVKGNPKGTLVFFQIESLEPGESIVVKYENWIDNQMAHWSNDGLLRLLLDGSNFYEFQISYLNPRGEVITEQLDLSCQTRV